MEPLFLITEYCEWGDLKQFLLAMRKDGVAAKMTPVRLPPLSVAQKLSLCQQVALGLQHLTTDLRLVHRDVASRNVLLSPSLDVKVASPALCRDVYASEYVPLHQRLVPVRWSSPELLASFASDDILDNTTTGVDLLTATTDDQPCYSAASDAFAFGVFVWEVFTLGELPLRHLSDDDVIRERRSLVGGRSGIQLSSPSSSALCRLQYPPGCPADTWHVVERCLADCVTDRPSFVELSTSFGQMLASIVI
jgi:serine/threonine protein kinase